MMTLRRWVLGPVAALALVLGLLGLLSSSEPLAQGQPGCTVTVQPGQSIQKTIDQVSSRAVICLGAGEWKENVIIEKSLTLRAAEIKPQPDVVIRSVKKDWPVILIRSEEPIEVTIIGLKITGAFGECYKGEPEWICADGISVHGQAKVVIENTTISGNKYNGIVMESSSQTTIKDTTVTDNERNGIWMSDSAQATIEGTTVSGNEGSGLSVWDSASVTLINSTVSDNRSSGLKVGRSASVTLIRTAVSNNKWHGLYAEGSTSVSLIDSIISCSFDGLLVRGLANVTLTSSSVSDNGTGLEVKDSAQVSLINSIVSNNRLLDGLLVSDSAIVSVIDSSVSNNNISGISVGGSAHVSLANSMVFGNEFAGLEVATSASVSLTNSSISDNGNGLVVNHSAIAEVKASRFLNNKGCGIFVRDKAQVHGTPSEMQGNGVDLCGNASASLRKPLVPQTDKWEIAFPGEYQSLQEVIDAVAPGGKVVIAPGSYETGLTIWKPVTVVGSGQEQTELRARGLLIISVLGEVEGVRLEGLRIGGGDLGLLVFGREVALQDVLVSDNGEGLRVEGSASVHLTRSSISDNGIGLTMFDSANMTLVDATISSNGFGLIVCLSIFGASFVPARFCSPHLSLSDSMVSDSRILGLAVGSSASVSLTNSTISGNSGGFWGSFLVRDSARVSLSKSTVSDNKIYGIWIDDSAQVIISDSQISHNEIAGIGLRGSAQAEIRGSVIKGNGKDEECTEKGWHCNGISIGGKSQVKLISSKVLSNADWGVGAELEQCSGYDDFTGQVTFEDMMLEDISGNNTTGNQNGMGNPGNHPWNRPDVPDGQVCLP